MVKNGPSPTKTFYCTEKEESELPPETLLNALKDDIEINILKIFLETAYESLLLSGRRKMEEKAIESFERSSQVFVQEEETRSSEEEVIKLMQLMNLMPLGNRESRLTGLDVDDDGKSWKLVRETVERRGRRFKCDQELAVKMILNNASKIESSFQEALEEETSSSSIRWGFAEAKDEVVSLGFKLSHALIKITLLRVHESEREKQLWLRNLIFESSFKKRSAVMYLFDFLLYKSEEFAECVVMEESGKDNPSDLSIPEPEEDRIGLELLDRLAHALCRLQLLATNLSLTKGELNAVTSELLQCVMDVKYVEKTIGSLMKGRSLKLKHKAKQSLPMKKRSETIFWAKVNGEMNKCWGESFWKYVEAASHLESVVSSHQIVYALCKFFVFGFES
ncbi:PREDICTED: uncharacterized protein LOC104788999 [Camelina sativa]|uniref:Uncharacterized protein LOC104788999 n=1 Tax=Camelina sativa TaxID=90675 RepID=A0ABM0ZB40_CAMSA|nr:PREDICTED: uncharacterized protein LOC104788999 [Camelina sativa]